MATELWSANRGFMASETLSEELRFALQPMCRFRQFCDVEVALGKNVGDTYNWNIYGDTDDEADELDETLRMPETGFPISDGTVRIVEFGISVPYTGLFDNLSEHPVKQIIHNTLKRNANRAFDRAAHAQFDATLLRAVGGAAGAITLDDDGTPTGSNNIAMSFDHVKTISDTMQERNIPLFDSENYVAVMRPSTMRPVLDELEDIHKYVPEGWGRIMNGEKGRADAVRFVSQTNIPSEAWANAKSDAAFFFGADTATEVVACPEEIRGKIPDDYGRGKGIAWYYIGNFAITHANATNAATKAQARIIKWDSAT
jgi:N4-gp56 family major capsid protein